MKVMQPVTPEREGTYVCVPVLFKHPVGEGYIGNKELWLVDVRKVPLCDGRLGYTCPTDDGDGCEIRMVEGCGYQFFGPIGAAT